MTLEIIHLDVGEMILVKSIGYFSRILGFSPQHPHGNSQPPIAPILGDLVSSYVIFWPLALHACGAYIHAGKTSVQIQIIKF